MQISQLSRRSLLMIPAALVMTGAFPMMASEMDSRIESSAVHSYNFKTFLKEDSIKVSSSGGAVTLTGTVSQEYHKELAQETVAGLPGVKSVSNQLVVVGDQPSANSDAWITMKVKAILAFHKNVSASSTEVKTENGVVSLSGKADSEAQKQLTGEYAKDVDGVAEVRNDLIVTPVSKATHETLGMKVDDTSITAQVKSTLLFHKSTHALATRVTTKDGTVTLRGEAQNASEKELVTKLATDIKGVKHVKNHMTVSKP